MFQGEGGRLWLQMCRTPSHLLCAEPSLDPPQPFASPKPMVTFDPQLLNAPPRMRWDCLSAPPRHRIAHIALSLDSLELGEARRPAAVLLSPEVCSEPPRDQPRLPYFTVAKSPPQAFEDRGATAPRRPDTQ